MAPLSLRALLFFTTWISPLTNALEIEVPVLPFTPNPDSPPLLTGRHLKITVIEEAAFVNLKEDPRTGELSFSGYLVDIIEELSLRANFTYELKTPSGFGSLCVPRLPPNNSSSMDNARYRQNYRCGECDVNDRPLSHYSTDMYVGAYYITPQRLLVNKYTIPYSPPDRASLGMMGTATHIRNIHDLKGLDYRVCALGGTAYMESLQKSFPHLNVQGIEKDQSVHTALSDGTCDIIIDSYPHLFRNVLDLSKQGKCRANGKPIGVIGEPLDYGLNYFAFGLRKEMEDTVVEALNFWLQALMACFPQDPNGYCPNGTGSLSQLYYATDSGVRGRGDECGYVQFPVDGKKTTALSPAAICAIAITPVIVVLVIGMILHTRQLKSQEHRLKKRFVQQLARNIDIQCSSHMIPAEKLTETYQHISDGDGQISKTDLARWMNDLHMDFLTEREFDHLWISMDVNGTGMVDPIDFFAFLRECEHEFKEVHEEIAELPKSEKHKLAARRLTNINTMGLEEVEKMERRNNKRSRQPCGEPTPSGRRGGVCNNNNNTAPATNFYNGSSTALTVDYLSEEAPEPMDASKKDLLASMNQDSMRNVKRAVRQLASSVSSGQLDINAMGLDGSAASSRRLTTAPSATNLATSSRRLTTDPSATNLNNSSSALPSTAIFTVDENIGEAPKPTDSQTDLVASSSSNGTPPSKKLLDQDTLELPI